MQGVKISNPYQILFYYNRSWPDSFTCQLHYVSLNKILLSVKLKRKTIWSGKDQICLLLCHTPLVHQECACFKKTPALEIFQHKINRTLHQKRMHLLLTFLQYTCILNAPMSPMFILKSSKVRCLVFQENVVSVI